MRDGFTLTAFAGSIEVCRETIEEWRRVHPAFSVACARGMALAQLHWERRLSAGVNSRDFQANAALTMMKARFTEFREPSKLELSGSVTIAGISESDLERAHALVSSIAKSATK